MRTLFHTENPDLQHSTRGTRRTSPLHKESFKGVVRGAISRSQRSNHSHPLTQGEIEYGGPNCQDRKAMRNKVQNSFLEWQGDGCDRDDQVC